MPGGPAPSCSACGEQLGDPSEEVAHPEDDNPPEDAHFTVQIRDDGAERAQCTKNGQLASVVIGDEKRSPISGEQTGTVGEGDRDDRQKEQPKPEPSEDGSVYDLPQEKDQIDILEDVVTNPHYELKDDQISEIRAWAEDYDGQMPPNVLENLLKNLKGVQKQTAELLRERYELKLNKWVQKQSSGDDGPPIGAVSHHMGVQRRSGSGGRSPAPTPAQPQNNQNQKSQEKPDPEPSDTDRGVGGEPNQNLRRYRKERRTKRRHDTADIAAEEVAKQVAPQVAAELTGNLGTYFGLPAKIIEAKIEKDPDWALEKAEALDIDIMEFLGPSESRKEEMQQDENNHQPQVDNEMDQALNEIRDGGGQAQEPSGESNKSEPDVPEPASEPEPEPREQPNDDDESFEDIFGEEDQENPTEVR